MKIHSRAEWNAAPPRSDFHIVPAADREAVMAHYADMQEPANPADFPATLRGIQRFHQTTRAWKDIAYNHLIFWDGSIWEGRGWGAAGGHCTSMNTPYLGVCYVGNDDAGVRDLTPAAQNSFAWYADEAERRAGHSLKRLGHRDGPFDNTRCPGDEIYQLVVRGGFAPATPRPERPAEDASLKGLLLSVDAVLDAGTRKALQRMWGTVPDGVFGPNTWRRAQLWAGLTGADVDGLPGPITDAAILRRAGRPDLAAAGVRWNHAWRTRPDTVTAVLENYYNRAIRRGWRPRKEA